MIVCIHEDRPSMLPGARLLVASLRRHCPDLRIVLSFPSFDSAVAHWAREEANVEPREDPSLAAKGWNIKPTLILAMLDRGEQEVVWIDSDVILTGDFRPLLEGFGPETFVTTEDEYWGLYPGGTIRAELWGLEAGRPAPCTANTGFIRATPAHRELLEAWRDLLAAPTYRAMQEKSMFQRPIHMIGDQDVLTALLGSRRFGDLPMAFLKRGSQIVQSNSPAGYTVRERIGNLGRGLPPLIHCSGPKPWLGTAENRSRIGRIYERLYLDVCPYTWAARRHGGETGEDERWMETRTWASRLCRALSRDSPNLQGMALALFHSLGRRIKRGLGRTPWPSPYSFTDEESS